MVDEYAQTNLAQRISTITGVAQVQVFGSQKYAVRVQLDPRALTTRGIGIDEVEQALARSNVNLPTGTLYGAHQMFNVQATGQLTNAAAFRPLVVAYRNGSPVRLEELGRVIDSVQTDKVASWYNDERAVILAVQRQPGTNTVEVVDAIRTLLPRFRSELPASVNLNVLYDRSVAIRESVHDVEFTLLLSITLVVLVIFLFLRNLSATIIPSLAVPLSIIGTFAAMYLLGYTIDIISLMALTLCVGFVVDDAVVMLENIVRHMEDGKGRLEAALIGAKEIGFTILSMTLSLAAVFIPVLFMGGVVGRLLHEFAVVITVAVLVSGFVSLTLTPMACSRFLRPPGQSHSRLYAVSERFFDGMLHTYDWTLRWVLAHRRTVMGVMLLTFVLTAWLFVAIPKGFIPTEDTGRQDHRGSQAEARDGARAQGVPAEPADHPDRWQPHEGALPVHAPGHRPPGALSLGADPLRQDADASGLHGRQHRPPDHEPAGDRRHRPGQGLGARRDRRADRERAVRRLRLAPGLDDLHADEPVLGHHGARSQVPARPHRALAALRALAVGQARAAQLGRAPDADHRAPDGHAPGPAPGGDDLVQPPAWRVAQRGGGGGPEGPARAPAPGHDRRELPGHGPGVPGVAQGPGAPPRRHDPGHPSRARHSLRELHPSAHDPLGVALGGRGSAADADVVQVGAQRLRLRRDHHAGRNREEERDHDDRLRARGRARGRHAGRRDLQGVPAPVPAHHDDDDGRAPRHAPDRPRHRRGRRRAARAGVGGRGRPAPVAAPDALYHARALHLHGVGAEAARDAPRAVPA